MPQEKLDFGVIQESSAEPLAGASPIAMNVVIDSKGAVRRRPGIQASSDYTSSVIDADGLYGLHYALNGSLYAVGGAQPIRSLYRVGPSSALDLSSLGGGLGDIRGTGRPIFAETEPLLIIASGAEPQKLDFVTSASARLGGTPPNATHVIANASRLLLNNAQTPRGQINYSSPASGSSTAGFEDWGATTTSGFFAAEARPDPVVALHENLNEVLAFGTTTLQVFSPDETFVYATVSTRELGCAAPYSVIKFDGQFAWLDHSRRFVKSDGRSFDVLSDPIKGTLDGITTISDCFGYRVVLGNVDAFVWTFPTDGRTFVYNIGGGWSQWSSWSDSTDNFATFAVNAHHLRAGVGDNIVGLGDGRIGVLKNDAFTDFGMRIAAYVETGFQDRGTDRRKHCKLARFALRRGVGTSGEGQTVLVSWRDDLGAWNPPIEVSLGAAGDLNPVVELRSLGVYRRRQWRFEFANSDEMVLAGATEEYDILDV